MKITRQELYESYDTTSGWLKDFSKRNDIPKSVESSPIGKSADYLSNLKSILNKNKDFKTIDEKMADMKQRLGFGIFKETSEDTDNLKSASESCGCNGEELCSCASVEDEDEDECDCGKCEKCMSGNKDGGSKKELTDGEKEIVSILRNILSYIKDFASDRPDVAYGGIMTHCREHPKLGFDKVESRIDHKKLETLVKKILEKSKVNHGDTVYVSESDAHEMQNNNNEIADYMSHANPGN